MARYGAKYLRWAKIASDADTKKFPTYENSLGLGPLVVVTDNIAYAEAKNYGDNELQENVNEFQQLTADVEMTEMPMESASAVYGAKLDAATGDLSYGKDDTAPDGGLAFYTHKMVKENGVQKKYFQGVFYPCLTGSRQGTSYNTKSQSITFANGKAHFVGKAAANGIFQHFSKNFETEAEAKTWVDALLPPAAAASAATE